jgi:hypothetical protein
MSKTESCFNCVYSHWDHAQMVWNLARCIPTRPARAYDRKAVELFGESAKLDFPDEWPDERRQELYAMRNAAP